MNNTIIRKSELVQMKIFENLFIEMSAKSCNQRCKHCYINFPQFKKVEDYIKIETINKALNDLYNENIKCIYLTGAEPMTHPDFNSILRLCLKKTNVCICTNGSFINEKKARFLKKVYSEFNHELFFEISLDYYDEVKNDDIRYRGAYRHAIFAIKYLIKNNFSPIIHTTNYYNESDEILFSNFYNICSNIGYELDKKHLKITPYYDKNLKVSIEEDFNLSSFKSDCQYGRILSEKGVYTCPFLSNDYRGRCGSNFSDYSKINLLETEYCSICSKSNSPVFGINFSNFS